MDQLDVECDVQHECLMVLLDVLQVVLFLLSAVVESDVEVAEVVAYCHLVRWGSSSWQDFSSCWITSWSTGRTSSWISCATSS